MQKIYTEQTLFMVAHIKNLLESEHIHCELRNQYTAGGVGELSFIDTWPELWVNYEDVARAKTIIDDHLSLANDDEWTCRCGEMNGAAFSSCWSCGRDRPDSNA